MAIRFDSATGKWMALFYQLEPEMMSSPDFSTEKDAQAAYDFALTVWNVAESRIDQSYRDGFRDGMTDLEAG